MKRMAVVVLIFIVISACTNNTSGKSSTGDRQKEWNSVSEQLGLRYDAIMNWEKELDDALTIQLQNKLKLKRVLFKDYYLDDMYKQGAATFAKFDGFDGKFLILRLVDQQFIDKIIDAHKESNYFSLVVDVRDISSPVFSLSSGNKDEDGYAPIEVSTDTQTIIEGMLVDYVTN